jgi:hypothetical protein
LQLLREHGTVYPVIRFLKLAVTACCGAAVAAFGTSAILIVNRDSFAKSVESERLECALKTTDEIELWDLANGLWTTACIAGARDWSGIHERFGITVPRPRSLFTGGTAVLLVGPAGAYHVIASDTLRDQDGLDCRPISRHSKLLRLSEGNGRFEVGIE